MACLSSSDTFSEAFRWTEAGGMVGLGFLSGKSTLVSSAGGVSADGSVVVGESGLSDREAFRWTEAGGMIGLGDLPGGPSRSEASAVSADGTVVVGEAQVSGTDFEAFRWTEAGGMVGLGVRTDIADAVSADGGIIIGNHFDAGPFIWDASNGTRDLEMFLSSDVGLDLTGWELLRVNDISANGNVIVGGGRNPSGRFEGWIAVIPEPTTCTLALAALCLAMSRRRAF